MTDKELKKLLKEAKNLRDLCDPGCWGRCQQCPQQVVDDLIKALQERA